MPGGVEFKIFENEFIMKINNISRKIVVIVMLNFSEFQLLFLYISFQLQIAVQLIKVSDAP